MGRGSSSPSLAPSVTQAADVSLENRSRSVARQQEKEVSVPGKVARWRDARALTHS